MITITNGSLHELFMAAATGPFMTAKIVPVSNVGILRVTCNWLYSSLNCDPNDTSSFLWQFSKVDEEHISLSPVNSCIGQTIYASVRDDIGYQLQVQAPYSADWITGVGRDEIIGLKMHDLSICQLTGFNGAYISVASSPDSHGNHSGYRLKSDGSSFDRYQRWFLGIQQSLQSNIQFSGQDHSITGLEKQLVNCGIQMDIGTIAQLSAQLSL